MVTDDYRDWAIEQLRRATDAKIAHRAMFGGVGVYGDGVFFALMADELVEAPEELGEWVDRAMAVARAKKGGR